MPDPINDFDWNKLGWWGPTLAAVIFIFGQAVGWITKAGIDAWERVRRRKIEEKFDIQRLDLLEDEQLKDGFKILIKKQDRRISILETRCDSCEHKHSLCMQENATMAERNAAMADRLENTTTQMKELINRVQTYRAELSAYRRQDPFPSPDPQNGEDP